METLLKNIHPSVDEIRLFSTNIANKDKRLVIKVAGESYTLSPKLTAEVRTKKIKLEDLGDFVVREVEAADGTTMKSLGYPGEDTVVKVAWSSKKTESKVLSVDDFESLLDEVLAESVTA